MLKIISGTSVKFTLMPGAAQKKTKALHQQSFIIKTQKEYPKYVRDRRGNKSVYKPLKLYL
jgi:hypothetical protein